jgi:Ca2+ transporting ATPase
MMLILEVFDDLMLKILLCAAFVALIIGMINEGPEHGWIEGSSIFFAVGIIVTVTAGNNYLKEKQFQKLKARQQDNQKVAVYRGTEGMTVTLGTQDLVVGDIIKIEPGSQVPADCIMISGNDLACDESA